MATTDPSVIPNPAPALSEDREALEAYIRVKPQMDAMNPDQLPRITVDLRNAAIQAVGVVPRILPHRDTIVAEAPNFPIAYVDNLQDYAFAMLYTHVATKPTAIDPALQKLIDEGTELRGKFFTATEALVAFGLLDAERVANFKAGNGHADLAADLLGTEVMFRENWASLQGNSPVTKEMLDRASTIGNRMVKLLGPKRVNEQFGDLGGPSADDRERAYALFINAYEQCRHAIAFIRRDHGDAETIAPSVFVRARRRATSSAAATGTEASTGAPAVGTTPATPAPVADDTME